MRTVICAVFLVSGASWALADEPSQASVAAVRSAEPAPCAGCGQQKGHPLPTLSRSEFARQLVRFASEPLAPHSQALETLLFHGAQAHDYLAKLEEGQSPLDSAHQAFLEHELARGYAVVALRVLDSEGRERLTLAPTTVPLRVKRHLHATSTNGLQETEISGTAVRVGLDRLWVRY